MTKVRSKIGCTLKWIQKGLQKMTDTPYKLNAFPKGYKKNDQPAIVFLSILCKEFSFAPIPFPLALGLGGTLELY